MDNFLNNRDIYESIPSDGFSNYRDSIVGTLNSIYNSYSVIEEHTFYIAQNDEDIISGFRTFSIKEDIIENTSESYNFQIEFTDEDNKKFIESVRFTVSNPKYLENIRFYIKARPNIPRIQVGIFYVTADKAFLMYSLDYSLSYGELTSIKLPVIEGVDNLYVDIDKATLNYIIMYAEANHNNGTFNTAYYYYLFKNSYILYKKFFGENCLSKSERERYEEIDKAWKLYREIKS